MGLESATYIHELVPTNPVGATDPKSQGDDHIRMFKQAVQNTLPNVEGAVQASHTQLDKTIKLSAGTFTPTASNLSAGVANVIPGQAMWHRVEDIVHVSGLVTFIATTAAIHTFNLSLPIASNLAVQADLAGTSSPYGGGLIDAAMTGDAVNNAAQLSASVAAATYNMAYTFSYRVLV